MPSDSDLQDEIREVESKTQRVLEGRGDEEEACPNVR